MSFSGVPFNRERAKNRIFESIINTIHIIIKQPEGRHIV